MLDGLLLEIFTQKLRREVQPNRMALVPSSKWYCNQNKSGICPEESVLPIPWLLQNTLVPYPRMK